MVGNEFSELLSATAYGVTVALQVGEGALAVVVSGLPHWWQESPAVTHPIKTWVIASDATTAAIEATVSELENWVAEHAVDHIFIHAGVVAIGGRALLLPGRSMAGKTTLTAALVREGAAYGSDEYAPLRVDGRVETYARPLWIRPIEGGPRRRVSADELGGTTFLGTLPVGGVAMLTHNSLSGWEIRATTRGSAVLSLFDNCVAARLRPESMLRAVTAAVVEADAIAGTRGEAEDAASRLLEWMDRRC